MTLTEERERLARDLHDTVIQRLFGVGLALQISLPSIVDDDVRDRINNVLDELDSRFTRSAPRSSRSTRTTPSDRASRSECTRCRARWSLASGCSPT